MNTLHNFYENVRALYDAHHFAQVQTVIEAALTRRQLDPRLPLTRDTLFLLGASLARMGNLEGAERWFRQILRFNPRHFKAAYFLGVVLERKGRLAEALKAYFHANQLDPTSKPVNEKLAALRDQPGAQATADASTIPIDPKAEPHVRSSSDVNDDAGNAHIRDQPVRAVGDPGTLLLARNRRLSSYLFQWLTAGMLLIFGAVLSALAGSLWPLALFSTPALLIVGFIFFNRLQKTYNIFESKTDHYWGIVRKKIRTYWMKDVDHVQIDQPWAFYFTNTARIRFWADPKGTKLILAIEAIDTLEEMEKLYNRFQHQNQRDRAVGERWLAMPGAGNNLPILGQRGTQSLERPISINANKGIKRLPVSASEELSCNTHITHQAVRAPGDPGEFLSWRRRRISSYPFHWLAAGGMMCAGLLIRFVNGSAIPFVDLEMAALVSAALILLHRITRTYTIYESKIDWSRGIFRKKIKTVFLMDVADLDFDQPWGFWLTGTARIRLWADEERAKLIMAIEAIDDLEAMETLYHRLQNQNKRDVSVRQHLLARAGDAQSMRTGGATRK